MAEPNHQWPVRPKLVDFKIINLNARSGLNKSHLIESLTLEHNPDILAITETWLHSDVHDVEVTPPGYVLIRKDRDGWGGGVALVTKRDIGFQILPGPDAIEAVWIKIRLNYIPVYMSYVQTPLAITLLRLWPA